MADDTGPKFFNGEYKISYNDMENALIVEHIIFKSGVTEVQLNMNCSYWSWKQRTQSIYTANSFSDKLSFSRISMFLCYFLQVIAFWRAVAPSNEP